MSNWPGDSGKSSLHLDNDGGAACRGGWSSESLVVLTVPRNTHHC